MDRSIAGTRLRARRRQMGITQADLARTLGISASYLNLIEANKRRIGGQLLSRAAEELGLALDDLDGAAEQRLNEALVDIAQMPALSSLDIEHDRSGEFIGRFPGWARAMAALARSEQNAQRSARVLADRLSHDPFLGEAVHRMLSRIASIRSAAEIMTEYDDIDRDQRQRFDQIIFEESRNLAEVGEALAAYFDKSTETDTSLTPLDEVEAMFESRENRFAEIEDIIENAAATGQAGITARVDAAITEILTRETSVQSAGARSRARDALSLYAGHAMQTPMSLFAPLAQQLRFDIEALATATGAGLYPIFRRLTALPPESGIPRFGYLRANAAGTITEMLGLPDLAVPRYASACPLWLLYRAQQAPETMLRQLTVFPNGQRFVFVARARNTEPPGFDRPRHYVTDMLAMRAEDAVHTVYAPDPAQRAEEVGPACRLCPRTRCRHRVDDPLGA
ncbi:MAG: short-chain fatty acyl-CoA regulator family protein [Pseudomonadota bacterium]